MIWLKMLIGALVVLLIQLFAQSRIYYLAALVPLFPTFTLIGHFLVGTQRSSSDFKVALVFSLLGVIPHICYTFTVLFSFEHMALYKSLGLGVIVWLISAGLLIFGWEYVQSLSQ